MHFLIKTLAVLAVALVLVQGDNVFSIDASATPTNLPHVWEECVGSGHAVLALRKDYQDHLTQAHSDIGFKRVRFHGLFDDDMSVFQFDDQGRPVYSWFNVDQVFDFLLSIGMEPYVEISFMPELLASGNTTIMHYKGNTTPPKNYTLWDDLVKDFANHLVERYSIDVVSQWSFEVWNEPNCGFFDGTQQQWFTHYTHTALAMKSVDSRFRVGGPVTCQSAWIPEFIDYCNTNKVPFDFIATHEYPTDITPLDKDTMTYVFQKARKEAGDNLLYYSEFNDGLYANPAYHDTPFASAFLFKVVHDTKGLVDLMSWWTFSDIFEEQGQTSQPFFIADGWGLLNIYQIPKPSYRAFQLLHNLGTKEVAVSGVDPNATVGAWAVLNNNGGVDIVVYNFDVPTNPCVNESVTIVISNLKSTPQSGLLMRIDDTHANAPAVWTSMGSPSYPSNAQIQQLITASEIQQEKLYATKSGNNQVQFDIAVPKWGSAVLSISL